MDAWRKYLFHENGGSADRVMAILRMFAANPGLGALAPVDFEPIRLIISWGYNRPMVQGLLALVGHDAPLDDVSLELPSGSMFWFRVKALRGLLDAGITPLLFDREAGQIDGTLAHAIERSMFFMVEIAGYDWARFHTGDRLDGYNVTDDIQVARSRLLPVPGGNRPDP